jgi:hypothetical protein
VQVDEAFCIQLKQTYFYARDQSRVRVLQVPKASATQAEINF